MLWYVLKQTKAPRIKTRRGGALLYTWYEALQGKSPERPTKQGIIKPDLPQVLPKPLDTAACVTTVPLPLSLASMYYD